ncbi:MAG: sugar kinase, partial [Ruminococcaceae bacterium]|nr:sugar kinase [Oscillospiraceae bacterium]
MEFVCFGEIMGCLNPEGYGRIAQAPSLAIRYGGGEANVAASLASFGKQALYVTKVPDNELSKAAIQSLTNHNVDVSRIVYGGDRLGLYFIEQDDSQRLPKVLYDRKYSSISM